MPTLNAAIYGAAPIDTGSVAIPGTGTWTSLGTISLGGGKRGVALLLSNLGANAFTGVKITRAVTAGGTHKDWLVNTDFNTATEELLDVVTGSSPPNIHTLASGATGEIKFDKMEGTQELAVWVMAASATSASVVGTAD
jgi:hypothetical protein